MIVNDLAVARYQPKIAIATTECVVREDLCRNVNASTKTIVFECTGNAARVANWRGHFKDLNFLAKHFLVRNIDGGNSVARHYTICNAMKPEVYSAYVNALKPENDPNYKKFDRKVLDFEESN